MTQEKTKDTLFLEAIKLIDKVEDILSLAIEVIKKEDKYDLYEDEIRHIEYEIIDNLYSGKSYLDSKIDSIKLEKITIQTYSSKLEEFEQRIKQLEDKKVEGE